MDDGYRLTQEDERMAGLFYGIVRSVWEELPDKSLFAVEKMGPDWYERNLRLPGFGVLARDASGAPAGVLIAVVPDGGEENLGRDAGLPEEALPRVIHMDTAAVLPQHRGHRLEARMLAFAEECLAGTPYVHMLCTISPDNAPSLRSAQRLGYRVAATKEKYGGRLRCVLRKDREATECPKEDPS